MTNAALIRDVILPDDPRLAAAPSTADAVLLRHGRIEAVGAAADLTSAAPDADIIDGGGGLLLPGFTDCHGHLLSLGEALSVLDLSTAANLDEVIAAVKAAAASLDEGSWLIGRGWRPDGEAHAGWLKKLDAAAPQHPVILNRFDHHGALVNSAALRTAGIDETSPAPAGGRISKDGGRLTGLLLENAADLVRRCLPAQDSVERARLLDLAARRCLELGVTAVHDAIDDPEWIPEYLARTAPETPRVYGMLRVPPGGDADGIAATQLSQPAHPRFEMQRLRLVLDGGLGARGALFGEEYSDDPGNRGLQMLEIAEVERAATAAMRRGHRICVHAIGDAANTLLLDAYERLSAEQWAIEPRMVIEHATVLRPDDVERMARIGVIGSVQPNHLYNAIAYLDERLGAQRRAWAYPFAALQRAGVTMAFGTDFPVAPVDPLTTLHAAVTRQNALGEPRGGYVPEERIGVLDALVAATCNGAVMAGQEHRRGRIAVGMDADLVILDTDITRVSAEEIPSARVTHTFIAGDLGYTSR